MSAGMLSPFSANSTLSLTCVQHSARRGPSTALTFLLPPLSSFRWNISDKHWAMSPQSTSLQCKDTGSFNELRKVSTQFVKTAYGLGVCEVMKTVWVGSDLIYLTMTIGWGSNIEEKTGWASVHSVTLWLPSDPTLLQLSSLKKETKWCVSVIFFCWLFLLIYHLFPDDWLRVILLRFTFTRSLRAERTFRAAVSCSRKNIEMLCSAPPVWQSVFTITEKAPTRAFPWLKAPTMLSGR